MIQVDLRDKGRFPLEHRARYKVWPEHRHLFPDPKMQFAESSGDNLSL